EFDQAEEYGVLWRLSSECALSDFTEIRRDVSQFLASLDYLYLSVSLDLFSVAVAPGVSAPSLFGLDARTGLGMLRLILDEARRAEVPVLMADIAECNPLEDPDGRTARLAAGLIFELARS
ncbi:arginase family protein, partial [Oceanospirillum sp. HFRX-1_2]